MSSPTPPVGGDEYEGFVEDILPDEELEPGQQPAAPLPGQPAPADSAAQPVPADGSPARDERGRFAQKAVVDAAATEDLPSGKAPPVAPAATPPSEPAPGALRDPSGTPYPAWTFKADRQELSIPGSALGDEGAFIPRAALPEVQALIAEGMAHRGSWRQRERDYQSQIERLQSSRDPEVERARAFNQGIMDLFAQGPEAVAAWLDDYQVNFPKFMAEAEAAVLRAQHEQTQAELGEYHAEQEAAEFQPVLEDALDEVFARLKAQHPQADAERIADRIVNRLLEDVVYEVPPEERRHLEPGERLLGTSPRTGAMYVLNEQKVADEFGDLAGWGSQAAQQAATAAAHAVQANAARLAPTGAPPGLGAGGAPPPGPSAAPLPKTPEELEKWLEGGGWKQSFPTG